MLDRIFEPIFAPFRWLRSVVFGVKQGPARIKGEIMRAQSQVETIKSDFREYKSDINTVQQKGQQYRGQMQGGPQQQQQQQQGGMQQGGMPQQGGYGSGMPQQGGYGGMMQGGAPQQGGAMYQGGMPQGGMPGQAAGLGPTAGKKKMGFFERLFGGKKKCPSCGQKLHKTWTECPFCGWGRQQANPNMMQAPMPSQGQKMRTMALDMSMPLPMDVQSDQRVGWFIPLEGQYQGELFQIRAPRTTIGKSPDCNIVVNEGSISGHHAEFVSTANGFRLNDLGSTNGTWVNDKRVMTHDLVDNDNVRLGRLNFKYKSLLG